MSLMLNGLEVKKKANYSSILLKSKEIFLTKLFYKQLKVCEQTGATKQPTSKNDIKKVVYIYDNFDVKTIKANYTYIYSLI